MVNLQLPGYKNHDIFVCLFVLLVFISNFRKGTWKLRENIRCVGGGEIRILPSYIKTRYKPQHPKKFHRISDARASFSSFFFFSFLFFSFLFFSFRHRCKDSLRFDIQISFGYKYAVRCHRHANNTKCHSS